MLISPRHLVDRFRYPRSRADELAELRARFSALPARRSLTAEQRASADELRRLREELSRLLGRVSACHGCAKGRPAPHGHWQGGYCCGGRTLDIWSGEACAELKATGVDPTALAPPRGDHAGCAFRGERGCSLSFADRPSLCVRFFCQELRVELRDREDWKSVAELAQALSREQRRFAELMDEARSAP
jgi:hypothetical protein